MQPDEEIYLAPTKICPFFFGDSTEQKFGSLRATATVNRRLEPAASPQSVRSPKVELSACRFWRLWPIRDKIEILACVWFLDPNELGWVEHVYRLFALESTWVGFILQGIFLLDPG